MLKGRGELGPEGGGAPQVPGESVSAERQLRGQRSPGSPLLLLLGLEAPLGPCQHLACCCTHTLGGCRHPWMNEWLHEGRSFSSRPSSALEGRTRAPLSAVRAGGRPRGSPVSTPHPRAMYLQTLSPQGLSSARAPWTSRVLTHLAPARVIVGGLPPLGGWSWPGQGAGCPLH